MKKTLATFFTVICTFICIFMLGSCNENAKYAGTYKMVSITGSMTINGETTQLSTDLYEYYNIILNKDGTAVVESKGAQTVGMAVENEGTWEYEDGKIKLKSRNSGITVVEEMTLEGDTLTYVAEQAASGVSISMTIVLEKSAE